MIHFDVSILEKQLRLPNARYRANSRRDSSSNSKHYTGPKLTKESNLDDVLSCALFLAAMDTTRQTYLPLAIAIELFDLPAFFFKPEKIMPVQN